MTYAELKIGDVFTVVGAPADYEFVKLLKKDTLHPDDQEVVLVERDK